MDLQGLSYAEPLPTRSVPKLGDAKRHLMTFMVTTHNIESHEIFLLLVRRDTRHNSATRNMREYAPLAVAQCMQPTSELPGRS